MNNMNLTRESACLNTIRFLQLVVLAFGIKELCHAMAYYKQKKTKWAIASLGMGFFACACAIISMTGIL